MLPLAPARRPDPRPRSVAAALLALLAAGCGGGAEGGPRRPNVLLVSLDTLRPDHLGCYGHDRDTSPALDALAAAGVRFTDVTAAAPWTLPSHATMLTGLYPSRHGVKSHTMRLREGIRTVAEDLRDAGFETMAVVNTHNIGDPRFQLGQGFQHFQYVEELVPHPTIPDRQVAPNCGEEITRRARDLVAARDDDRPFFLFLHFYDAHTDFTPDPEHRAALVGPYDGPIDGSTHQLNAARNRGELFSEADMDHLRELYDAEIRTVDGVLGRFLAWLDEQGLGEDTIVVVTSDHGEEFQEHGGLLHGRTQYQELLSVPLIMAGPGLPEGVVVDAPVHGVDLVPTLLALVGVTSSATHDGLDLTPTWSGVALPDRPLFGEADRDNRYAGMQNGEYNEVIDQRTMVRRGSKKLIFDLEKKRAELFDLEKDPGEQNDLEAQQRKLARELARLLRDFLAGAVAPERIPPPTSEEMEALRALGYAGEEGDE